MPAEGDPLRSRLFDSVACNDPRNPHALIASRGGENISQWERLSRRLRAEALFHPHAPAEEAELAESGEISLKREPTDRERVAAHGVPSSIK
jgi:hypothetical protein